MIFLVYEEIQHIFRSYDIRGPFNKELTPEVVTRIGLTYGTFIGGKGTIITGRDVRTSSQIVENAFVAGLNSTGVDVISYGALPISTVNFMIWQETCNGGAVITASHNPAKDNGIRFRRFDGTGFTSENQKIKNLFYSNDFKRAPWDKLGKTHQISNKIAVSKYIDFILSKITVSDPPRVVLDTGNGAASVVAPYLFKKAGCQTITLNNQPDGTFPGRSPDPLEDPLDDLRSLVVSSNADLGLAFDGDGDRAILVDDKGRKVQTERAAAIIAKELIAENDGKGTVIANVSCSMVIDEEVSKFGGKVIRCRVGDVFVAETAKEHKAIFGVEISAHFFLPIYGYYYDDAIMASLLMASILSEKKEKFSNLLEKVPSYPFLKENIQCKDQIKFQIVEKIAEEALKEEKVEISTLDGVRITHENGDWILIRPSNTEPQIRIQAEAHTQERVKELLEEAKTKVIKEIKKLEN